SIRKGSFFIHFKIALKDCMFLIWKWFLETPQITIMREIDISQQTIIKFFKRMQLSIGKCLQIKKVKLGGRGILCQIDESLFRCKPKYHRGRASSNELWVFGIVDTSSAEGSYYLELVENRSASQLIPIIKRVCREGTVIVSDQCVLTMDW
ncbi:MAG: hypothetical protein ACRDDF_11120, partial [Aeromonas sp.]